MIRRLATISASSLLLLAVAPAANAAWVSSGGDTATVTATSVDPGNSPTPSRDNGTVALSWAASTLANGAAVGHYDVLRHSGTTTVTVCSGVVGTTCNDTSPLPGPVSYGVVPRIGTHWKGAESTTTPFQYDIFAPNTTITMREPGANEAGWNNEDVVVELTADDPEPVASGVKEIHYTLNGVETVVPGDNATFTVSDEDVTEITFWSIDNLGNDESAQPTDDILIDKVAPTTTASLSPTPNGAGWNNADVSLTLAASDARSGVSTTEYSLTGGAPWTTYTSPIPFTTEGSYTVTYRSTDVAGNVETNQTQPVKLDKTAPVSSATLTANSVSLSANDAGSGVPTYGISYKIASATSYTTYTTPFTLASGQTAYFRAVDNAGNLESPDKSLTNTPSDTTAPVTTVSSNPEPNAAGWNKANVTLTLNSVDAEGIVTKLEYRNGTTGAFTTINGAGPFVLPEYFTEGTTTVQFQATDNAANVEPLQSYAVKIDKTDPGTPTILPTTAGATNNNSGNSSWDKICDGAPTICVTPASDTSGTSSVTYSLARLSGAAGSVTHCWSGTAFTTGSTCSHLSTSLSTGKYRSGSIPQSLMLDGHYRVNVVVTDGAGRSSSFTVNFQIT